MKKPFVSVTRCCVSSGLRPVSLGGLPIRKLPDGIQARFMPIELVMISPGCRSFACGGAVVDLSVRVIGSPPQCFSDQLWGASASDSLALVNYFTRLEQQPERVG